MSLVERQFAGVSEAGAGDSADEGFVPLFQKLGGRPTLMKLLKHFYADVRQHGLLGPIFNSMIEDWPAHLELIGEFWSTLTGGDGRYAGPMPARHIPLGLREEHFQAWLGLWEHHCQIHLDPTSARQMVALAHHVASRLRMICGVPPEKDAANPFRFMVTPFPDPRAGTVNLPPRPHP